MDEHPIAVIGLGALLYGDQGLGLRVIEALKKQRLPKQVEIIEGGMSGLNLVPWMDDRKKVIFVSTMSTGNEPGTIRRLTSAELEELVQSLPEPVSHLGRSGECEDSEARDDQIPVGDERSLLQAIQTAEYLSIKPEVVIIGVQPASSKPGKQLSDVLSKKIPDIVNLVKTEISKK
jgi:hydrogenase maturation protease